MQYMSLSIKADASGAQLAENVMLLGQLHKLELILLDGDGDALDLVVPNVSLIEQLRVTGPASSPGVCLTLNKEGVRFQCLDVAEVHNADSQFSMFHSALSDS